MSYSFRGALLVLAIAPLSMLTNPSGARAEDGVPPAASETTSTNPEAAKETVAPAATGPADVAPNATDSCETPCHHGLLGPLRLGPSVSVGFPFLINYSLDATWHRRFGAAFSGGRFKREVKKGTEIEVYNWDLRGRWFPWQGSFFLGAAYGNQGIVGKSKTNLSVKSGDVDLTVPTSIRLGVNTTYMTPHLGWFATWDSGFTLGFEVGFQMPLKSKAELQTGFENVSRSAEESVKNSDSYKKSKKDVESAAETFGKKAVPYVNLLRIGWML